MLALGQHPWQQGTAGFLKRDQSGKLRANRLVLAGHASRRCEIRMQLPRSRVDPFRPDRLTSRLNSSCDSLCRDYGGFRESCRDARTHELGRTSTDWRKR